MTVRLNAHHDARIISHISGSPVQEVHLAATVLISRTPVLGTKAGNGRRECWAPHATTAWVGTCTHGTAHTTGFWAACFCPWCCACYLRHASLNGGFLEFRDAGDFSALMLVQATCPGMYPRCVYVVVLTCRYRCCQGYICPSCMKCTDGACDAKSV